MQIQSNFIYFKSRGTGADQNMNNQVSQCKRKRLSKKTLPKLRSRLPNALLWGCSLVLFLIGGISAKTPKSTYSDILAVQLAVLPFGVVLVEAVFRTLYLFEEFDHLQTRHESKVSKLLQDVFEFPICFYACSVVSSFIMVVVYLHYKHNPWAMFYDFGSTSVCTSFLGILLLNRVLKLNRGSLYDSLWIENSNGLDYGSGLAHSFFHGYLKIVIPKTGTLDKHLEELMRNYEDNNHVKLEFYKLFILIPKSLTCPPSLMNSDISPSIEESCSLPEKICTVAGVQNRVYKNSVYKIKTDKGKIYVAAEYATPLKTFKDVVSYNGKHSNFYNKHKNDIVLQFYRTLKQVLKEHDCTNHCELIFYDDKDEKGNFYDVGQILLDRINDIKKNKNKKQN